MEQRKAKLENKKGLVNELIKLVEGVRGEIYKNSNARSLRELKFNTNTDIVGVTLDKNIANPASYQLEVLQLAQKSSIISNGVEDKDKTYIGVGYLQYKLPNGETKDVYVDAENSSLTGIAKLINKDSENGMRATVVNDGKDGNNNWRLIVSLEETGNPNKATFPYMYFVDGEVDLYFDQERPAQNAKIKLDGFEIELPANKSDEIIPGVTIDLKKAKPGEEFALEVAEDVTAVAGKIGGLIENLNKVIAFIKEQNNMDESTDTSQTLGGDITLQQLESRIRNAVFADIKTKFGTKRLGDLGVTFQRDGLLNFDQAKFENELSQNYQMVTQVLVGDYSLDKGKSKGSLDYLQDLTGTALAIPNGLLTNRKKGIESNITQIDRQIESKERLIAQKEDALKRKFARLEETMSKIQSQGAGLSGMGQAMAIPQLG
jgi:flagellar hook-associated protein 2